MEWPIFIISLVDATERRQRLSTYLDDLGVRYEFVNAVDGRKGLTIEQERFVDRAGTLKVSKRRMSDTEYACALSHQEVYARILREELPGAVVMEDDAKPLPGFQEFLKRQAYVAADLIQLDYSNTRVWRGSKRHIAPGLDIRRLAFNSDRTTGYTVSRRGAEYLRRNGLPLCSTADWPCDIVRIGAQVSVPRLVDHPPDEDSYIETGRREEKRQGSEESSRWKRFGRREYWRRWLRKRMSVRIA